MRHYFGRRIVRAAVLSVVALFVFVGLPGPAVADEIRYRVLSGDTLIGIGESLLSRPADWTRVQVLNRVEDPYRIPVGTMLRIPVRLLRTEPREAEVIAVFGEARVDGVAASTGMAVAAGTAIETGDDGHIRLRLPDGSMLILPARSRARVDTLHGYRGTDTQDLKLDLERGGVESQVVPQRGPAARYRIDTPTAVIGVRGTDFRVAMDQPSGRMRAEVSSGQVRAEAHASPAQRSRDISGGFGLVAMRGERLPQPVRLLPPPATDSIADLFERPVIRFALAADQAVFARRVQVRADMPLAPVLFDDVFATEEVRIAGLDDGRYRLIVRGIAADGLEGLDAEHIFVLKARPEPPFLSVPPNRGKTSAGPVGFEWTGASEAVRYRVQLVDGVGDDAPVVLDKEVEGVSARVELDPGHYAWRVASIRADGDQGPWSDAASFEVRPRPSEPEPPRFDPDTISFSWSGEDGQQFEYQFAADEAFATRLYEGRTDVPQVSLARPGPATYWLRVRTIDPDGYTSPWTTAQRVVVPASFPWWLLLLPLLLL
jgi:hypothetical protein